MRTMRKLILALNALLAIFVIIFYSYISETTGNSMYIFILVINVVGLALNSFYIFKNRLNVRKS